MAEQKSRGGRGTRGRVGAAAQRAGKGAGEAVEETGSAAAEAGRGVADVPDRAIEEGQALKGGDDANRTRSDREPQTVRGELGAIVRETAIEILGPIARKATVQAARYAVRKAPELAMETVLPRLKELGSTVEEAGGPGAFARDKLSSASEGGGALSKLRLGRADSDGGKRPERVPMQDSIDVAVPLEKAYEQFLQLDDFAELLSGGDLDEERENERVVWTSAEKNATAVVTFHRLDDRLTRVMVSYDAHPQNFAGKALSALRSSSRGLKSDLARFKALAEMAELGLEDDGRREPSGEEPEGKDRRRRAPRADEPGDEEYDEEELPEAEVEDDEAESEDEQEPEAEVEDDEAESEDEQEPEAESEEDLEEESEPARPPTRKRAVRRRAPARPGRSARATRSGR